MRPVLTFIVLLLVFHGMPAQQQVDARSSDSTTNNILMLHAEAGYTNFHAWKLSDVFIAGGGKRFPALNTIGIGGLISADDDKFRFEVNYAFHYFLPYYNEAIIEGRTIKSRLQGWEFMWCRDGIDVIPQKRFDVSGSFGFSVGNLRLDWNSQRYTNPYVAPLVKIDTRVNVWKLSLGARASYRFDLTNGKWKRKSDGMPVLPEYKFREFQGLIYIGWIFYE